MARLLIVEDEKNLAKGMKFNFELEGYDVDVVGDGTDAVVRLAPGSGDRYDLVILDVMLPGMDGFAVADRTRQAGGVAVLVCRALHVRRAAAVVTAPRDEQQTQQQMWTHPDPPASFDHDLVTAVVYLPVGGSQW